jgi:tetratricopeptide (TPR) repeat protein
MELLPRQTRRWWMCWALVLAFLCWEETSAQDDDRETLDSMVDAHMEALDKRAASWWQQNQVAEAVKLYEEMAAYRPQHADSHFNVGIARYALGEHEACMEALDQALRLPSGKPHYSMYHQQMASCACKLGEKRNDHILWDKCIRHLSQAIYFDPRNVLAW